MCVYIYIHMKICSLPSHSMHESCCLPHSQKPRLCEKSVVTAEPRLPPVPTACALPVYVPTDHWLRYFCSALSQTMFAALPRAWNGVHIWLSNQAEPSAAPPSRAESLLQTVRQRERLVAPDVFRGVLTACYIVQPAKQPLPLVLAVRDRQRSSRACLAPGQRSKLCALVCKRSIL